jgi:hypothetical protein
MQISAVVGENTMAMYLVHGKKSVGMTCCSLQFQHTSLKSPLMSRVDRGKALEIKSICMTLIKSGYSGGEDVSPCGRTSMALRRGWSLVRDSCAQCTLYLPSSPFSSETQTQTWPEIRGQIGMTCSTDGLSFPPPSTPFHLLASWGLDPFPRFIQGPGPRTCGTIDKNAIRCSEGQIPER